MINVWIRPLILHCSWSHQKLLERTRARRENLQKKMAERPNAASRQMVKRPLADANGLAGGAATSTGRSTSVLRWERSTQRCFTTAPQASTTPSKRKCSEENVPAAAGEENQEPMMTGSGAPSLSDPPTDRKPPAGPASIRSASCVEKTATAPAVRVQPDPERMAVAAEAPPSPQAEAVDEQAPSTVGMKSRLQRLAQQRRCWEGGGENVGSPWRLQPRSKPGFYLFQMLLMHFPTSLPCPRW